MVTLLEYSPSTSTKSFILGARPREGVADLPESEFTVDADRSILKYRPLVKADYGVLYCWAENQVGRQLNPCRFEIVTESPPAKLVKCEAVNITWEVRIFGSFRPLMDVR